jgi:hypothetical protein
MKFPQRLVKYFALSLLFVSAGFGANTVYRSIAIQSSTIDSTTIGATTASSGVFTSLQDTGLGVSLPVCTDGSSNVVTSGCQPSGIAVHCTPFNMGSNVSGSLTAATVGAVNCTVPATGCPYRALVNWNMSINMSSNNAMSMWVTDGTNNFRDVPTNGQTSDQTGASQSFVTPVTYCNVNVTFTLKTQGLTSNYTLDAAPLVGSGANHGMDVEILSSN